LAEIENARVDLGKFKQFGRRPKPIDLLDTSRSVNLFPALPADARIISVEADYKRLMRSLKRGERLADIPVSNVALAVIGSRENIRLLQLSDRSYQLLKLCDGSRNVAQIADEFSSFVPHGISPLKASVFGLSSLAADGVIGIAA
jgi:hypothetical protein